MIKRIIYFLKVHYWMKKGFKKENVYKFLDERQEDLKNNYKKSIIKFAKKHEFFASTVVALEINENNYYEYLNDYDYWRMFPMDGLYHSWIDNKISLKYLLGDLENLMPEYYFQITQNNGILRLINCPKEYDVSINGILELLKDKKVLCIKATYGYGGKDFYKIEYKCKKYIINDQEYNIDDFKNFIITLDNFIIMEYLISAGLPSKIYSKTANSIRYIIGIEDGKKYKIGSFIKFGRKESGYVDNLSNLGISCPINENGDIEFGYIKENGVMKTIKKHPDTGQELFGKIKEWNEIEKTVEKIMERLPQLTYLGFDFVISTRGIRLLEINDKSGFLTIQKYKPLLKDKNDNFYYKRLKKIERK